MAVESAIVMGAGTAHAADLEVLVDGVRNADGEIRVAVCSEARFLQPACEYGGTAPAREGTVRVHIANVTPGVWAVQAFHDENRNGKLDTNILGIPTEGLGFSNGATFHFGPPRFGDAAFQLLPAGGTIHLALRYF